MSETKDNRFASGVNAIMAVVFILNLIFSHEDNIIMIALTGGGRLVDILSATNASVYSGFQVHRLITYGYLQPAIGHLLANVYALWYVGLYLEKALGLTRLFVIYHVGLIVPCAAFLFIFPNGVMYGASPAIFCCLGLMAMWLIKDRNLISKYRSLRGFRYLLCYMIISNFLGIGTFVVHFLGFLVGLMLGIFVNGSRYQHSEE
ncbi:rhomboid family intramembrane serine protease [Butyrivibrio sp. INlla16]|uniref:rhomboid family intramembrane serine protease n=1 Tax=Butyrivibrio sp. INlla16 TaxID=1520807 RepID=UPI000882E9D2|nr:rhomboid family intramembrane serine protease [Butyrivibrio sp. INlla16]SDB68865.1 Rhomboid family protein [Butyrivibrio sp. INlla16]